MKKQRKCKFLDEFKTFIMRGNVIDMAVGVIIGGAFQKIVTSVINDLIMPFVGLLTGDVNFVDQFVVLRVPEGVDEGLIKTLEEAKTLGATTFNYGAFITEVINFIIMAFIIFLMVKAMNKLRRKDEEVTTKTCPHCKSEIDINATRCPNCTSEL